MSNANELVISGLGAFSSRGYGLDAHWYALTDPPERLQKDDYFVNGVQIRDYITDRRMLKAISTLDGIGLASIIGLKADLDYEKLSYDPYRVGLYVGSVPSSLTSVEPYLDAMRSPDKDQGYVSIREFGERSQRSRPMTLLIGLLNNVLCYGSILLEARGPNSNYTSLCLGAHHALIHGAKRLRRQQLDLAIVGGYSSRSHPGDQAAFYHHGLLQKVAKDGSLGIVPFGQDDQQDGFVFADAAAFVGLERRQAVAARGGKIFGTYCGGSITNDCLGPMQYDSSGESLQRSIRLALADAGISWDQVGLVFASASGIKALDQMEAEVLSRCSDEGQHAPALACTSAVFGNWMEAGGIIEIGLLSKLYDARYVPTSMRAGASLRGFSNEIDHERSHALVLRTSPWGEYSCIVIRNENL